MTLKDCIDIVDNLKPNQYTIKEKVMWLSFIEEIIINEVLKTHEGYDSKYDDFEGYSEDKLSVPLIVPSPYDRLYTAYLKMKIDGENGETARYNNSAALYNTYMLEFRKHYNKTHLPVSSSNKKPLTPPIKPNLGLSPAEYENLKKDMTYILTEYFSNTLSYDKVYDAVNSFVQNNIPMLKGENGTTPVKGVDYYTEADINELKSYMATLYEKEISNLKATINTLKATINTLNAKSLIKTAFITLYASKWEGNDNRYYQTLTIDGATKYTKVDLQPNAEQLVIFYEKDIAFVTENENGNITVYCIGQKPLNDYTIQATLTEVITNG